MGAASTGMVTPSPVSALCMRCLLQRRRLASTVRWNYGQLFAVSALSKPWAHTRFGQAVSDESPYANMTDMVNADRARSRTFVVTGAASGIGLATAQRLLSEGGTVVGADLAAPPDAPNSGAPISGS